ncbi:carbonic anhydrase 2 [Beauveria brongniartii RCEF 3172]|uniref:Carbonic anhydrase 2 n=1 Tax=Beauveria brongniartii RCEF 3172 TaxID=1081107 RepID=A0A166RWU5_9HYPO|nr:carbonic anhydrase 2 [Beauveria brongniartii RCEF 3172]
MGRADRRKDYDSLYQQAVQDGRLCPDRKDVDALFDYRPLSGRSPKLYKEILSPWEAYVRNNPHDTDPHDIETLKHFIKFLALTMRGHQEEDNPENRQLTVCEAWRADSFPATIGHIVMNPLFNIKWLP